MGLPVDDTDQEAWYRKITHWARRLGDWSGMMGWVEPGWAKAEWPIAVRDILQTVSPLEGWKEDGEKMHFLFRPSTAVWKWIGVGIRIQTEKNQVRGHCSVGFCKASILLDLSSRLRWWVRNPRWNWNSWYLGWLSCGQKTTHPMRSFVFLK